MPKDSSPHWIWHSSAARQRCTFAANADPMAKGVDRALCEIVAERRQLDLDLAKAQVRSALANQRYHRDVH